MARIKLRTSIYSEALGGSVDAGAIVEVSDAIAKSYIAAEHAEATTDAVTYSKPKAAKSAPEKRRPSGPSNTRKAKKK